MVETKTANGQDQDLKKMVLRPRPVLRPSSLVGLYPVVIVLVPVLKTATSAAVMLRQTASQINHIPFGLTHKKL